MPTIALAHSGERHRSLEHVLALVHAALDHLGGIDAFIKPGQNVVIVPCEAASCWSQEACATDPLVTRALVHLAQNAGAARVQVLEPDADPIEMRALELGGERRSIALPAALLEADVSIAVPKAKTDFTDLISSTMEMWAAAMVRPPRTFDESDDARIERLADIMALIRPDLWVTDALICGEGDGPLANTPRWCGCILAAADPVAMDAAIAKLLGFDFKKLRAAAAGEERGLGSRAPIVWLGTSVERVCFSAWPAHQGFSHLPLRVLIGGDVTRWGTVGHVKSALDLLQRQGALEMAMRAKGTPTILIGDVQDAEFEQYIEEGPYIVFDDAARPEYKNDPRVLFVPGHPVMDEALPQLMRGLGLPGVRRNKKAASVSAAAVAALAVGAILGAGAIRRG